MLGAVTWHMGWGGMDHVRMSPTFVRPRPVQSPHVSTSTSLRDSHYFFLTVYFCAQWYLPSPPTSPPCRPTPDGPDRTFHAHYLFESSVRPLLLTDGPFLTQLEPLGKGRGGTIPQWGGGMDALVHRFPTRAHERCNIFPSSCKPDVGLQGTEYFHLLSGPPHIPQGT